MLKLESLFILVNATLYEYRMSLDLKKNGQSPQLFRKIFKILKLK